MYRELQFDFARLSLAFDFDLFALDAHRLPFAAIAIFVRIGGIDLFGVEVLLVNADDGEAEADAFVVPGGYSGQSRLARSDHIPSRADKVNQIAQTRQRYRAMGIISQNRFASCGHRSVNHPVVAAVVWIERHGTAGGVRGGENSRINASQIKPIRHFDLLLWFGFDPFAN